MSAYDGKVKPGGDPQTFTAGCLTVTKLAVDPEMSNNCYLLACEDDLVLIDAADDSAALLALIDGRPVSSIVTTHQHWDHHRALASVVASSGATTVAGIPDADAITEQTGVAIDRRVGAGDSVPIGACSLTVIPIAGHTAGSICLYLEASDGSHHLFTGDCLFPGGVGATFGEAAAFDQLIGEVETKLFPLPDDTRFYPGHGNDGMLGDEKPSLEEWRERGW